MSILLMGVVLCGIKQPFLRVLYQLSGRGSHHLLYSVFRTRFGLQHQSGPDDGIGRICRHIWTAWWLYFIAPLTGMLASAEIYRFVFGTERILCAKLHPDPAYPCPFMCRYPRHRHH